MPVVVVQKPKEKELKKGWRVRHKTITITKVKPAWQRRQELARKTVEDKEKAKDRQAAHNVMLIRVRGVEGMPEENQGASGAAARAAGKLGGFLSSIFGKKKKQA